MTDTHKLLTAKDLLSIRTKENNSKLVDLGSALTFLYVKYEKEDMFPYTGQKILVRSELVPMLQSAYDKLQEKNSGYTFKVQYGYRHPEVQQSYFNVRYKIFKDKNPNLSVDELKEFTHTQVALPEVAGHPTGGAVDLTILDENGNKLDMGTEIADYSQPEKCFTYSELVTEQQALNRALLSDVMIGSGFAPFNGEWWHFSYGDREWAKFYDKEFSVFNQIVFSDI